MRLNAPLYGEHQDLWGARDGRGDQLEQFRRFADTASVGEAGEYLLTGTHDVAKGSPRL